MTWMSRRIARRLDLFSVATSAPSTSIEPDCGATNSRISCNVVDLPEPDSPTMASVRPCRSSKLMPSTARTSPMLRRNNTPLVNWIRLDQIADPHDDGRFTGLDGFGFGADSVDLGGSAPDDVFGADAGRPVIGGHG